MYFKQFYLGCLAHASYLLGSQGEGVVIDPQRDVEQYIEEARAAGLHIKYVVETHLHADFVSGHRELAERTGATIVIAKRAGATFPHLGVSEGDTLQAGTLQLRFIETPGHTPEGISILVTDGANQEAPPKLFTGDTLFIGDVGRPDLSGGAGFTPVEMAEMLYESIHKKLLVLDDRTEVYPAHGAGSLCGRNMSKETWSTLGTQRRENYALRPMEKNAFVSLMTANMPEAPKYFSDDVRINREGAPSLDSIPTAPALSVKEVREELQRGALLLDVRPSEVYGPEHIPNSINIGLDGQFASWAGAMIGFHQPLIVVAENTEQVSEAIVRLARVGFTSVIGSLAGGIDAWKAAKLRTACVAQITPQQFAARAQDPQGAQLVDVRRPAEYETGAAPHTITLPLAELDARLDVLDPAKPTYLVCGSGYRSSIAASVLEGHGFGPLFSVDGGMNAYNEAGLPTVTPSAR